MGKEKLTAEELEWFEVQKKYQTKKSFIFGVVVTFLLIVFLSNKLCLKSNIILYACCCFGFIGGFITIRKFMRIIDKLLE